MLVISARSVYRIEYYKSVKKNILTAFLRHGTIENEEEITGVGEGRC